MTRSWTSWRWSSSTEAVELWKLVRTGTFDAVVALADWLEDDSMAEQLVKWLDEPLAATVSPVPVLDGPHDRIEFHETTGRLPPAPTIGAPNMACVAFEADVLRAIWWDEPAQGVSWASTFPAIARRMVNRGWRHVAAPGLTLARSSYIADPSRDGGWGPATVAEMEGPSNESLSTHRLWARTRAHLRLVIDAACLEGAQHSGSQALVSNVAEALAVARPAATVALAVEAHNIGAVRAGAPSVLDVIERGNHVPADVVYRPYQLLSPGELPWLTRTGERLLVGQLDMIGFSNPSYHPSPALFHTVRNLQRLTMRLADGITFISDFGRRHALVECPDLEADRCFVVSSGASAPAASPTSAGHDRPFVLCLSAVFWHKHRDHAIRTFASMVSDHAYEGDLLVAGPEPYYGRSTAEEAAVVASLGASVRDRIRHLGQVDAATRWALLAEADVVLYPSVVEGFGMVPFEAATVGTPTLVAPGSALAEVFGGTGADVGSWAVPQWSARAIELVRSPVQREAVVHQIMKRAELHSWATVAEATWAAIDDVLARPRARLHRDEGGALARVSASDDMAPTSVGIHFANRLAAYGRRRLRRIAER